MSKRIELLIAVTGVVMCLSGYFILPTTSKEYLGGLIYNLQIMVKWFFMIGGGSLALIYLLLLTLELTFPDTTSNKEEMK